LGWDGVKMNWLYNTRSKIKKVENWVEMGSKWIDYIIQRSKNLVELNIGLRAYPPMLSLWPRTGNLWWGPSSVQSSESTAGTLKTSTRDALRRDQVKMNVLYNVLSMCYSTTLVCSFLGQTSSHLLALPTKARILCLDSL